MILAEHLTKCFGPFTAIDDVSFEVKRGEIVGFLGPNGAGKSTTMRILAGVFPPTQGRALVAGSDVVAEPLRSRRVVGYFPERVSLYFDMTVTEYLRYAARMKEVPSDEREKLIGEAMEACGVTHMARRIIGTLSKGYRQRVGIAQAIVGRPHVLILDEPTSGLDPEQVTEVRALIRGLRGERTVILSTHILPEIEATCDRVIIINRGRILAVDTPQNLNQRLRERSQIHVEVRAPERDAVQRLSQLPWVISVEVTSAHDGILTLAVSTVKDRDVRGELAASIINAGWELQEMRSVVLSLESIFLTLVGGNKPAPEAA